MTEENKAIPEAEEATKVEAPKDEEPKVESKVEETEESQQIEAQLQKEKKASEAKDKIIADQAFKLRDKKRVADVVDEDEEEVEKPLTRSEVQAMLADNNKVAKANEIDDLVSLMSDNDKERELIKLTHKNRSYPAHLSLKEQLNEAYLVANSKKLAGENQELKRALAGKGNVSKDASTTHHDAPKGGEPKLEGSTKALISSLGFKWNGTSKRFEKKVKDGVRVRHSDGRVEFIKG